MRGHFLIASARVRSCSLAAPFVPVLSVPGSVASRERRYQRKQSSKGHVYFASTGVASQAISNVAMFFRSSWDLHQLFFQFLGRVCISFPIWRSRARFVVMVGNA